MDAHMPTGINSNERDSESIMLLRVMTYNILEGGTGREAQLLQVIQSVRPNVVVLQEVISANLLSHFAQELDMKAFFADGNNRKRVGLLSGLPVQSFANYRPFPPIWRNVIDARLETRSGKTVRVMGVHTLPSLWIGYELWRCWEAKKVLNYFRLNATEPCVILGDFNAIAPGDKPLLESMPNRLKFLMYSQGKRFYHFSIHQYLSNGLTDCFRTLYPNEDGFSLPATGPNARLDYIFANTALRPFLTDCRVVHAPEAVKHASDHCPVIAEFML